MYERKESVSCMERGGPSVGARALQEFLELEQSLSMGSGLQVCLGPGLSICPDSLGGFKRVGGHRGRQVSAGLA